MLNIKRSKLKQLALDRFNIDDEEHQMKIVIMLSTAYAARTSYTVVGDEKEVSYETLIGIHDRIITAKPMHSSPMEHCARAMSDYEYYESVKGRLRGFDTIDSEGFDTTTLIPNEEQQGWCRNYRGFIQYRHILEESLNK